MSDIYYWSPGDSSNQGTLGTDDHYLRLGAYQVVVEPKEAGIEANGVPQGIFFYTSGKYSLRSTAALHIAVDGPVQRTVKTGNMDYTNLHGNLEIVAEEGGIEITAEEAITITANETTQSVTTIEIESGDNDIYYIQGKYNKTVDHYQEKMVEANNHKTVIGLTITTQSGLSLTHSDTFELGYTSFSFGLTLIEIAAKGISATLELNKNSFTAITAVSFLLLDSKADILDEEFCYIKNEVKSVRFVTGILKSRKYLIKTVGELLGVDSCAGTMASLKTQKIIA